MAQNKMAEVAKLLGVEIGEEFNVPRCLFNPYYICESGLIDSNGTTCSQILIWILNGELEIEKLPFEPKEFDKYYFPQTNGYVGDKLFRNEKFDFRVKKNVGVYRTIEDARTKGIALGWEME